MKRLSISITILLLAAACQASPVRVAADLDPAYERAPANVSGSQDPPGASATQTDSSNTALRGMGMGSATDPFLSNYRAVSARTREDGSDAGLQDGYRSS
jgi:hypothetical protein